MVLVGLIVSYMLNVVMIYPPYLYSISTSLKYRDMRDSFTSTSEWMSTEIPERSKTLPMNILELQILYHILHQIAKVPLSNWSSHLFMIGFPFWIYKNSSSTSLHLAKPGISAPQQEFILRGLECQQNLCKSGILLWLTHSQPGKVWKE